MPSSVCTALLRDESHCETCDVKPIVRFALVFVVHVYERPESKLGFVNSILIRQHPKCITNKCFRASIAEMVVKCLKNETSEDSLCGIGQFTCSVCRDERRELIKLRIGVLPILAAEINCVGVNSEVSRNFECTFGCWEAKMIHASMFDHSRNVGVHPARTDRSLPTPELHEGSVWNAWFVVFLLRPKVTITDRRDHNIASAPDRAKSAWMYDSFRTTFRHEYFRSNLTPVRIQSSRHAPP